MDGVALIELRLLGLVDDILATIDQQYRIEIRRNKRFCVVDKRNPPSSDPILVMHATADVLEIATDGGFSFVIGEHSFNSDIVSAVLKYVQHRDFSGLAHCEANEL
jgi:hypothetical protein